MGSSSVMPPEKAGIWVYPYPTVLGKHEDFVATDEYKSERADGKETVFNLVTGLMGVMYLSGRIDLCDGVTLGLIKEGVAIYKEIREYTPSCRPIYPTGHHRINAEEVASFGLLGDGRLMLAVWNTSNKAEEVKINLGRYIDSGYRIKRTFSHADTGVSLDKETLRATVPDRGALWVEIVK